MSVGLSLAMAGIGAVDKMASNKAAALNSENQTLTNEMFNSPQANFNNEFLERNRAAAANMTEKYVSDKAMANSQAGGLRGMFGAKKVNKGLEQAQDALKPITQSYEVGQATQIGAQISNSNPSYQAPAYGKRGMKFKRVSKFSTKK